MKKSALHWLPVALGILFLLSLAYLQRDRALTGQNDFVQLYAGAELAGETYGDEPALYSRTANLEAIKSALGFTMETVVYTRPPFYAALLKPLAFLPYRAAYALFTFATLLSTLWFIIRFSKECEPLPFFAAMSIPAITALCGGQDTPLLLVILGGSILLTRRKMDFLAGLVLSLCAIKFHLFLFLPILLLIKGRWRILAGAASGTALLTAFGLLVAGPRSIPQYMKVLRDPWINPSATVMPNLHGLIVTLHLNDKLEFVLVAAVFAVFLWMLCNSGNYEFLFAASLVCGLLVSFHSGIADDIILLPVFVLVVGNCTSPPLRAAAGLILTPIPYFLVLAEAPYSAFFPVALLAMLGMFCLAVRNAALAEQLRTAELFV
jgi:hypothetical protein